MKPSFPMPTTGADYRWVNLVARVPSKGVPRIMRRAAQGLGGQLLRRHYVAGGQALTAGLFAGILRAGIPALDSHVAAAAHNERAPRDRRHRRPRRTVR